VRKAELGVRRRPALADEDRPEDGEAEAGAEVARGLRDAGDLAVAGAWRAVDSIGARGTEHQADSAALEHHVRPLVAKRQVGELVREQIEADRAEHAAVTKARARISPATGQAHVATLLQPDTLDCWSPSTISPIAALTRTVPR
jgi:hypothetical protein